MPLINDIWLSEFLKRRQSVNPTPTPTTIPSPDAWAAAQAKKRKKLLPPAYGSAAWVQAMADTGGYGTEEQQASGSVGAVAPALPTIPPPILPPPTKDAGSTAKKIVPPAYGSAEWAKQFGPDGLPPTELEKAISNVAGGTNTVLSGVGSAINRWLNSFADSVDENFDGGVWSEESIEKRRRLLERFNEWIKNSDVHNINTFISDVTNPTPPFDDRAESIANIAGTSDLPPVAPEITDTRAEAMANVARTPTVPPLTQWIRLTNGRWVPNPYWVNPYADTGGYGLDENGTPAPENPTTGGPTGGPWTEPEEPEEPGGGGGGGGGGKDKEGKWEETYHVAGAPDWWRGLTITSKMTPELEQAMLTNAMIPFMSPEDQRAAAQSLYIQFPKIFSGYSAKMAGFDDLSLDEKEDMTAKYYSKERSTQMMQTLSLVKSKLDAKNAKKLGPGFRYLMQLGEVLKDFGGHGGNLPTRESITQMMGALDPLIALTKSDNLSAYGSLSSMLTRPFSTNGNVLPVTKLQTGEYMFGEANRLWY